MKSLLLLTLLLSTSAQASEPAPTPKYCVWPAVGGAVGGVAIAWYGFVGLTAAAGGNAFDLPDTPLAIGGILALETVGLVGGATAACAIWGNEGRWFPTAGSVITGGMIGGTAFGVGAYQLLRAARVDSATDFPITSVFVMLGSVTGGAIIGGVGGYLIDDAIRGPPIAVAPVVMNDGAGISLSGSF